MMDSQEKDLETGKIEEVNKVEEPLTAAIEPEETSEVETDRKSVV